MRNLPIEGEPQLPGPALDLCLPHLAVLSHWLGETHVKYGLGTKVVT